METDRLNPWQVVAIYNTAMQKLIEAGKLSWEQEILISSEAVGLIDRWEQFNDPGYEQRQAKLQEYLSQYGP